MRFKGLGPDGKGPRRPSLPNLLWIMRQIDSLEPFSKEIVKNYALTGQMPDEWSEVVQNCYAKHFGISEKNEEDTNADR